MKERSVLLLIAAIVGSIAGWGVDATGGTPAPRVVTHTRVVIRHDAPVGCNLAGLVADVRVQRRMNALLLAGRPSAALNYSIGHTTATALTPCKASNGK